MVLHVADGSNKILDPLLRIERVHHLLRLFCNPRMSTKRCERIRRECLKIRERETPSDILKMRIQTLASMNYNNARQTARSVRRAGEVAADFSIALR
jgi:hypothetical protein